jgi:hypothetical protein
VPLVATHPGLSTVGRRCQVLRLDRIRVVVKPDRVLPVAREGLRARLEADVV